MPRRAWFGYSDDDAFADGLTCGGELDVLVQRVDPTAQPHLAAAFDEVRRGGPTAVAQVVDGPEELLGRTLCILGDAAHGTLDDGEADRAVTAQAAALLRAGRTARVQIGGDADACPEKHDERLRRLREAGVPEARPARLRSPIGIDLGVRTPEETAVSITAEIISHADHATGLPLHDGTGPIHGPLVRRQAGTRSTPYVRPAVSRCNGQQE